MHTHTHIYFFFYVHHFRFCTIGNDPKEVCTYLYSDAIVMHIYTYSTYMFDNVLNFPDYMVKGDRIPVHVVSSIEKCDHFTIIS